MYLQKNKAICSDCLKTLVTHSVLLSNRFIIKAHYPSKPIEDVKGAPATTDHSSRNTKEE
jgi:hypothetical protein